MTLTFRPYSPQDRRACVNVFCSNTPRFFREHERTEFETFIDSSGCPYFVVEQFDKIIGCGGYGIRDGSDLADMCWGMIAADCHGNHLGEYLLLARLNQIVQREDVRGVRLATSQHTAGFFQRYGFTIQTRQPDGIDDGLDEIEMLLELTKDTKPSITERWLAIVG